MKVKQNASVVSHYLVTCTSSMQALKAVRGSGVVGMALDSQTMHDAAFLSRLVYQDSFGAEFGDAGGAGEGWRLVSRSELGLDGLIDATYFNGEFLFDNVTAQAFVARRGSEIALVFRGTDPFGLDLVVDATLPATLTVYYELFRSLINAFVGYAAQSGASTVYAFGHSLGGAIAELFAERESGTVDTAVTFGSPGISTGDALLGIDDPRIVNFEHTGDPVPLVPFVNPAGVETDIDLPTVPFQAEHSIDRYLESARMILESELWELRGSRQIVLGRDSASDVLNLSSRSAAVLAIGGGGSDDIFGSAFRDLISGGNGSDDLRGQSGADSLYGGDQFDFLYGGGSNDALFGGASFDHLFGEDNVDTLYGGAGNDIAYGGTGDDNLFGDENDDQLFGEQGDDTLTGGASNDRLLGGEGNDTYIIETIGDQVFETTTFTGVVDAGGLDIVRSSVSFSLDTSAGVRFVERLALTGTAGINGTGNALSNVLTGNSGNNLLIGGIGNDTLNGGAGDDRLNGGTGDDLLIGGLGSDSLQGGAGNDVFRFVNGFIDAQIDGGAGIDTLDMRGVANAGSTSFVHIEVIYSPDLSFEWFWTSDAVTFFGGSDTETVQAGTGVDTIFGGGGDDDLYGGNGTDRIDGGLGADYLFGGAGNDTLAGGVGADSFFFADALGSGNVDVVSDFSVLADTIQIDNAIFLGLIEGALAATAFASNTSGNAADASDRIIYESDTGRLYFDRDGTGAAVKVHFATLATGLTLTSADFFVF